MNVKKLKETIDILKDDLGNALINADIWTVVDGRSIVSHNSQPKAVALFNRITKYLVDALEGSGFPPMEGPYTLSLADNKFSVQFPLGDYQLGMLVDTKKIETGLLLNVTLPKAAETLSQAIEK